MKGTNSASYRKINDRSRNSSTYHKKDGTAVRAILDREAEIEILDHSTTSQRPDNTAEIAYRIPGGEWRRRTFRQERSSGVFFRGAWTLDEFIEHLLDDGAEIRWGEAR